MTQPIIAIDAMGLRDGAKGGPRALLNLLRELPTTAKDLRYVALLGPDDSEAVGAAAPDTELSVHRQTKGTWWEMAGAIRAAQSVGADLLYTTREATFALTGKKGIRLVLHLHEPPWYRLRARTDWPGGSLRADAKNLLISRLVRPALRGADAVVASTQATAHAITARTGVEAHVAHLGVDPIFLTERNVAEREPFFLHLASGDRRDNTPRVIRAWENVRLPGFRLLVVGMPPRLKRSVLAMAASCPGVSTVDVLGWLTDQELRSMYDRCWALIGPSLYEGFGLEPLEALARGAPVIVGDLAASREVLGQAAEYCDPRDQASIERSIRTVVKDGRLRERLCQDGPLRAASFSWAKCARRLSECFMRVLED